MAGVAETGGHYGVMTCKCHTNVRRDPGKAPVAGQEHRESNKMCVSVSAVAAGTCPEFHRCVVVLQGISGPGKAGRGGRYRNSALFLHFFCKSKISSELKGFFSLLFCFTLVSKRTRKTSFILSN